MTRNMHTGISGRRRPKKNGMERVNHAKNVLAFLKAQDTTDKKAKKAAAK